MMPDVDKTIRGLTAFLECNSRKCDGCEYQDKKPGMPGGCKLDQYKVLEDALDLLKDQEDLGTELMNAVELIHKKNERIEKLLKEQETANIYKCPNCGTWVSAENVVRCKDCKHYMTIHCTCDGCCISDDWFCADGKRR